MARWLQRGTLVGLCVFALGATSLRAQQPTEQDQQNQSQGQTQQGNQQQPSQAQAPIPAYRSPLASAAGNDDEIVTQEMTPDTRALSGAQQLTLGVPTGRSYWQPHVDLFLTADSNPLEGAGGGSDWSLLTSISGGVDLHRVSGNNDLALTYTSGGVFSNNSGASDGVVQGLSVADKFAFHRSVLTFIDYLSYLPESSLGYGGLGGVSVPGGTSTGLGNGFTPGQSVLTGQGQNLSNSFDTELDTFLTPRTSITLVGGFSVLHYFDNGLLNYNDYSFRGGFNHQLNRYDTIALLYTYTGIRYSNIGQSIDEHIFQASYAKRITGRLAFQVAAGPELVNSQIAITGNQTSTGGVITTPGSTNQILWALDAAVTWQKTRNLLTVTYDHGVSGGSGVLAGAVSDIVTGSVTHQVSRTFSDTFIAGYSRNDGVTVANAVLGSQAYDYWFVGASATHPIGRTLGLTLAYQLQYQSSNQSFCLGPTCGTSVVRNLISFGIGWHDRPRPF